MVGTQSIIPAGYREDRLPLIKDIFDTTNFLIHNQLKLYFVSHVEIGRLYFKCLELELPEGLSASKVQLKKPVITNAEETTIQRGYNKYSTLVPINLIYHTGLNNVNYTLSDHTYNFNLVNHDNVPIKDNVCIKDESFNETTKFCIRISNNIRYLISITRFGDNKI